MKHVPFHIRLSVLPLVGILLGITLLVWGGVRLSVIDTDVTRFLPQGEAVLSDAAYIFAHNPIQGEIAVDLGVGKEDPDRLVAAAAIVQQRMMESGLFARVGTQSFQSLIPGLFTHIASHLPVLFTEAELQDQVLPRLSPEAVDRSLSDLQHQMLDITALGQGEYAAADPLGIRNTILAKLAGLSPVDAVSLYKGNLLSTDRKHLLIVAEPKGSGTDTAVGLKLETLMQGVAQELSTGFAGENPVSLSPVGAYRDALDNERIARRDVQQSIVLSTIGIALFLILSFPRPLVGLFAFLPAVAGTAAAYFVLALFHKTVSIMALGFGGAIVSITIDHAIAYLLFLDQSRTSYGHEASKEIWSVGLMAALTTVGGFAALTLTGFPVFVQLGQFTALGMAFSYVFVHFFFPLIFKELPGFPERALPFRKLVSAIPISGKRGGIAALVFGVIMLFFATPKFNVSLSAMNTVTSSTKAAEELVGRVWGSNIFSKIYLMTEGSTPADLQKKGDLLLPKIVQDLSAGRLSSAFLPAMVFPGEEGCRSNFAAWKKFWTKERIAALRQAFGKASDLGFSENAFEPFFAMISSDTPPDSVGIPEKFYPLFGIMPGAEGSVMQFATLVPGEKYQAAAFHAAYGKSARIFDAGYFSERLGHILFSSFMKITLVVLGCVALLLLFFFLDVRLTAIALAPMVFAMVSTLATLNLMGNALDIPTLMLSIIVLGMGVNYSIYLVCSYQRYGTMEGLEFGRIKLAVVLDAVSTLVGFGVLCFSEHAMLRSAGLTSLLGITYSLIGAFAILPPLLTHHFNPHRGKPKASAGLQERLLSRYRFLETYPRLFARFKFKTDPLFPELSRILEGRTPPEVIFDIGCGFGVPGAFLLETFPEARLYGIDPDAERTRVAASAFGSRGEILCAAAPDIPVIPAKAGAAFLLDIIHFIDDGGLALTLSRLREAMAPGALLVIRAIVPSPDGKFSWWWRIDAFRMRLAGIPAFHRPISRVREMVEAAGFKTEQTLVSGENPESEWLVAHL